MLKPGDAEKIEVTAQDIMQRGEVEAAFDEAIVRARRLGHWPAVVLTARDGIRDGNVEYVAQLYRAEGWEVMTEVSSGPMTMGTRAIIDRPKA